MFHRTACGSYLWTGIFLLLKGQEVVMFFTLVEVTLKKEKNESPRLWEPCSSHGLNGVQSQEQPLMNHVLLKIELPWLDLLKSLFLWVVALIMPLDSVATWQVVQEHCSLPDIFKFKLQYQGVLPWKVDWLTLGPFPLGCASFYIIGRSSQQVTSGRVGQRFYESLWNWSLYCLWLYFSPPKWIVKWFHKFVQEMNGYLACVLPVATDWIFVCL